MVQVLFRLHKDEKLKLKITAAKRDISMNQLIGEIIADYFKRNKEA